MNIDSDWFYLFIITCIIFETKESQKLMTTIKIMAKWFNH